MTSHVAALCRSGFYDLRQLNVNSVGNYQQKLRRHLSRHSFHLAGTTATPCCTEWPTNSCGKYSRCRMLITGAKRREHITPILRQLHWLPVRQRVQDCQLGTKCCQAKYLAIWLTIFLSPQKVLFAASGPLRWESALSLVFRVVLVTDVLLQLDHVSGTTYLPVCDIKKSAQNSEDNWKMFQTDCGASWLIIAPHKYSYLLTYLLTYLLSYLIAITKQNG